MKPFTYDQQRLLHSYSIFPEAPERTVFTLADVLNEDFHENFRNLLMTITQAPNEAAAVSHFSRRYGMFFAMQFYFLCAYDEIWDGPLEEIKFDIVHEYGVNTVATFINSDYMQPIDEDERQQAMQTILQQGAKVVAALREVTSISPITIWENFFGYILWHYHTLLENPGFSDQAMDDIDLLEDNATWANIAKKSLYADYTKLKSPSALINGPTRKSCCLSKDIPGLLPCGFCPLT